MGRPTIDLAADVRDALERLASAQKMDPNDLANEALRAWLQQAEEDERKVLDGVVAADAGEVVAHDRVREWLSTWGTDHEAPRPR